MIYDCYGLAVLGWNTSVLMLNLQQTGVEGLWVK